MRALLSALDSQRQEAVALYPELADKISKVEVLGAIPDGRIPNLEGPRANCHTDGILSADVVLVPLEDGDRCEALIAMGKTVCVVDLNPLSRTARMASITIVDELTRCIPILLAFLMNETKLPNREWNNGKILHNSIKVLRRNLDSLSLT